ncbi:MAG: metallophosphoesterase [Spirochaetaceae bacterium]|jgi:Icc-related predicted phosphoesterase|nr:metallophosphoesterase [Spirochaetaceae bacterium]
MKILCVSDYIDPLVYSSSIKERFGSVDMVLGAGDLPLDYLDFIVSSLNKPVFFVFGNHNLEHFSRYIGKRTINAARFDSEASIYYGIGAVFLGGKIKKEDGLLLAGLGGSMLYNNGKNQWTEFGMTCRILRLVPVLLFNKLIHGRYLDILLTHASPAGIHDKPDLCHKGFKCFLRFMRFFRPKYLVHGHIHLYDAAETRCTKYCDTLVVNAYSHYIIED